MSCRFDPYIIKINESYLVGCVDRADGPWRVNVEFLSVGMRYLN